MGSKPRYSPLSALKQLTSYQEPETARPPGGLVDAQGIEIPERPRIETCCILLLAFVSGSPMVPDDFHTLPKSAAALKDYVRPDGGVYLGSFQAPNDPAGVVVVFGDPMSSQRQAVQASLRYRRRLQQDFLDGEVRSTLGPFAAALPPGNQPQQES